MIVGLTGGIGAGKSTVATMFARLGAVVVDADDLARQALEPGSPLIAEVAARFDAGVVVEGVVNRQALADVVFKDDEALRDLEGMIHPEVARRLQEIYSGLGDDDVLVYAVPLLAELGMKDRFDAVVVVMCVEGLRRTRLRERGMSDEDIDARIAVQASDEQRNSLADFIIDNSSDLISLEQQVTDVWDSLTAYA